jgi:hypothetical protein
MALADLAGVDRSSSDDDHREMHQLSGEPAETGHRRTFRLDAKAAAEYFPSNTVIIEMPIAELFAAGRDQAVGT